MGKILAVQAKDVEKAKADANVVKDTVQISVREAEKVAATVETVKQVSELVCVEDGGATMTTTELMVIETKTKIMTKITIETTT